MCGNAAEKFLNEQKKEKGDILKRIMEIVGVNSAAAHAKIKTEPENPVSWTTKWRTDPQENKV